MKPSVTFLLKVKHQKVYSGFGYTPRCGGYFYFRGGEATYKKHLQAGYVNHAPGASLGRRGFVTLTAKGNEALRSLLPADEQVAE